MIEGPRSTAVDSPVLVGRRARQRGPLSQLLGRDGYVDATGQMEVGRGAGVTRGQVPVAVLRSGPLVRIDDPDCMPLHEGDLLVSLAGTAAETRAHQRGRARQRERRDRGLTRPLDLRRADRCGQPAPGRPLRS